MKPLGLDESERLISQYSQQHAQRYSDDRTRRLLQRYVAQHGGDVPVVRLEKLSAEYGITPAKVREYNHETGVCGYDTGATP